MATPVQALTFYLNQAIGGTDTSIIVRGLKDSRGNSIVSMPAGATIIYATIEPRSPANQEIISFTGITDNGNGIVTLTGVVRNLNPQPPYTALAGNVAHGNGAEMVLSNNPAFYNTFLQTDVAATISALYTFLLAFRPVLSADADATTPTQLITYGQLLRTALGTTFPYGTVLAGTAGENVTSGNLVYLDPATQKWFLAKSNTMSTLNNRILGIARSTATTNNSITNGVLLGGFMDGYSGLTLGIVYATDTGAITSTAGTNTFPVGVALTTATIVFDPTMSKKLTYDEKLGLAGYTNPPNALNKVLTEDFVYEVGGVAISQATGSTDVAFGENDATTKRNKLAQSFLATKRSLASVIVAKGNNTGTPTGDVVLEIYADNGNAPSGAALASVTMLLATWNAITVGNEATFTFATPLTNLVPNTRYWFRLTSTAASSANYFAAKKNASDVYANGSIKYNNITDGWVSEAGDLYFKIIQSTRAAVPVTDPTTGIIPSALLPVNTPYDYQAFTTVGANTWTKPAGVQANSLVYIQMWGGGGGGASSGNNDGGAGGGGGAYVEYWIRASLLGATETVTVGAGGTAGTGGGVGGQGGNTTFGTWATAYGGGGGGAGNGSGSGGGGGGGDGSQGGVGGGGSSVGNGGDYGGNTGSGVLSRGGGGRGNAGGAGQGGSALMGGGGGGGGANAAQGGSLGGNSMWGGGGGSGASWDGSGGGATAGGTSKYAGAGGASVVGGAGNPGVAPAGGGAGGWSDNPGFRSGGAGARGEARIWTFY